MAAIPLVSPVHGRIAVPTRLTGEVSRLVRARDLAITYPSLAPDAPAEEAARLLAEDVADALWRLLGGITTSRLIRQLLGAQ